MRTNIHRAGSAVPVVKNVADLIGILATLAGLAALLTALWYALSTYFALPIVEISHATRACVRVEVEGQEVPCSSVNLETDRYVTVWVQ